MEKIYISYIAERLQVKDWQVENCVSLFDDGATIPFISRYRKERTGGLDEVSVAEIRHWADVFAEMEKRKATVLQAVEAAGYGASIPGNEVKKEAVVDHGLSAMKVRIAVSAAQEVDCRAIGLFSPLKRQDRADRHVDCFPGGSHGLCRNSPQIRSYAKSGAGASVRRHPRGGLHHRSGRHRLGRGRHRVVRG